MKLWWLPIGLFLIVTTAHAEVRTVVPGDEYRAGSLHRFFLGDHWRDLWTVPLQIPVLDLDSYAGGLRPLKHGGGKQTKGLRLVGKDGREYKFRSLNKDPKKVLPEELQDTIVADVVQDQISTANPVAPLIVAPLALAAGVLQTEPRLVIMPDSSKLGEFREEFKNMLGTIEENPTTGDDGATFDDTDKLWSTFKIFKKMELNSKVRVDEESFLNARLFDIFIGDWDRHQKQWKWARKSVASEEGDETSIWEPIARDRDQAFARYDGILPWLGTQMIRQLNGVTESYPRVQALTWSGRYVDRRLLNHLTRDRWQAVTLELVSRLTDETIESAVSRMPPEMFELEGKKLIHVLKARRDHLAEISEDYYRQMARFVDLRMSEKSESFDFRKVDDRHLKVTVESKKGIVFERVFDREDTKEIRVFLSDNDRLVTHGMDTAGIWVRAIQPEERRQNQTDAERFEPTRDYGHDWWFAPLFSVSSDRGLLVGGGPILYEYDYQNEPYSARHQLRAGYAFIRNRAYTDYAGDYRGLWAGHPLFFDAKFSQIEILNTYGPGNETPFDEAADDRGDYKINQSHLILSPKLAWIYAPHFHLLTGVTYKRVDLRTWASGDFIFEFDTRDINSFASRGQLVQLKGSDFGDFQKASFLVQNFVTFQALTEITLGLSAGGEKLWGVYPFEESAFLGNSTLLRGFRQNRFAGDSSLVGAVDLRFFLSNFRLILPGRMGVSTFIDSGRVFLSGEDSHTWHTGYGGGIWASYLGPENTLNLQFAHSTESNQVSLGIGATL